MNSSIQIKAIIRFFVIFPLFIFIFLGLSVILSQEAQSQQETVSFTHVVFTSTVSAKEAFKDAIMEGRESSRWQLASNLESEIQWIKISEPWALAFVYYIDKDAGIHLQTPPDIIPGQLINKQWIVHFPDEEYYELAMQLLPEDLLPATFLDALDIQRESEERQIEVYNAGKLPWTCDQSNEVLQDRDNPSNSHKNGDKWAWDFGLSTDEAVTASRSGVVAHIYVGTAKNTGCRCGEDNWKKANRVVIDHQDGTASLYLHLSSKTPPVSEGDTVAAGDVIGYADHTGESGATHLHFAVQSWDSSWNGNIITGTIWYQQSLESLFDDPNLESEGGNPKWPNSYSSGNCGDINTCPTTISVLDPLDGTLIKTENDSTVYFFMNGYKQGFQYPEIFDSYGYDWGEVVIVDKDVLNFIPNGSPKPFRDGTLLKGSNPSVYVIEYGKKREFNSGDTFLGLGYTWTNIINVNDTILNSIETGPVIDTITTHPNGTLIKTEYDATVYLLVADHKRAFTAEEILFSWGYKWEQVVVISEAEMASYTDWPNMPFRYGTLLKGSGATTYVMEQDKKRGFTKEEVFLAYGYCWDNIMVVPDNILASISEGDIVRIPEPFTMIAGEGGTYYLSADKTLKIGRNTFVAPVTLHYARRSVTETTTTREFENLTEALPSTGILKDIGLFYSLTAQYSDYSDAQPVKPYTITVNYNQDNVPPDVDENYLSLYYWYNDKWVKESTSLVNVNTNVITANATYFGLWGVLVDNQVPYTPNNPSPVDNAVNDSV